MVRSWWGRGTLTNALVRYLNTGKVERMDMEKLGPGITAGPKGSNRIQTAGTPLHVPRITRKPTSGTKKKDQEREEREDQDQDQEKSKIKIRVRSGEE